jgi:hypothetical protein
MRFRRFPERAIAAASFLILIATSVSAQTPAAQPAAEPEGFLTRTAFSLSFAHMDSGDPRFTWVGHLRADVDLVKYKQGRLNFFVDDEPVLGSERRAFDLNHQNFIMESSLSYRVRSFDVAVVFHHESRHLVDRETDRTIAWNTIGARATRRWDLHRSTVAASLEYGHVLQHTYVDYAWTSQLAIRLDRPMNERLGVYGAGSGVLVGVDGAIPGRERQCGARLEGGLRLAGLIGGLDLFGAYERRIDGYPLSRQRSRWFEVGFRLNTR